MITEKNFSFPLKNLGMTEFYIGLTDEEIERVISEKLKIYPHDVEFEKIDGVKLDRYAFEFEAYVSYRKLDHSKCKMLRYMGIKRGITIYNFYNVFES